MVSQKIVFTVQDHEISYVKENVYDTFLYIF